MISTTRWRELIERECEAVNPPIPPDVFEAMVLVESNGNPKARSASDARGLCQIIPRWHQSLGLKVATGMGIPLTPELWYDPEFSVKCGTRHLSWLYASDPGEKSWVRAIRKYHLGSYEPSSNEVDGQGTSSDQHISKFHAALDVVRKDRGIDMVKTLDRPILIAIGMGHRNTGRGGALDEFGWTPGAARALARRAKARGMIVELIQENDGDTDPNMSNTDRMTAVRRAIANIAKKHGRPVDVVVHMHYNGGGAAGAHFIYRDGWEAPYRREDNMGDVRMCRAIKKHLKATETVGFLWWSGWPDEPGVMSEKDTGAVARRKGYRLGEKLATDQWRATLYSVIAEAGSIGVKLEAAYIRDPRWVEYTYCESILNGIEDEVGLYRPSEPNPKPNPTPDPTPVEPEFPAPIRIPELDVYKGAPDTNIPIAVKTESSGTAFYIGQDVTVIRETARQREIGSDERTGVNLNEGEVFHAWWGLIDEESGRPYTYTVWASRIWLDDTDMGMPS